MHTQLHNMSPSKMVFGKNLFKELVSQTLCKFTVLKENELMQRRKVRTDVEVHQEIVHYDLINQRDSTHVQTANQRTIIFYIYGNNIT